MHTDYLDALADRTQLLRLLDPASPLECERALAVSLELLRGIAQYRGLLKNAAECTAARPLALSTTGTLIAHAPAND